MKRTLLYCLLVSLFITCGNPPEWTKIGNGNTIMETEDTLNRRQLDSLCVSDSISNDIGGNWFSTIALTENKEPLVKYGYIKEITDSTETIYTLYTYQDTLFVVNKRVTKP